MDEYVTIAHSVCEWNSQHVCVSLFIVLNSVDTGRVRRSHGSAFHMWVHNIHVCVESMWLENYTNKNAYTHQILATETNERTQNNNRRTNTTKRVSDFAYNATIIMCTRSKRACSLAGEHYALHTAWNARLLRCPAGSSTIWICAPCNARVLFL